MLRYGVCYGNVGVIICVSVSVSFIVPGVQNLYKISAT